MGFFCFSRAVIQPQWFVVPVYEAAFRVSGAHFGVLSGGCFFWRLFYAGQRLFFVLLPVGLHGSVKLCEIFTDAFRALLVHSLARIRVHFQVGAVGIENASVRSPFPDPAPAPQYGQKSTERHRCRENGGYGSG